MGLEKCSARGTLYNYTEYGTRSLVYQPPFLLEFHYLVTADNNLNLQLYQIYPAG
jgi:hypothetical protein